MQNNILAKKALKHLRKDPVMYISAAAAAVSAIFVLPSIEYLDYIDFRVISLLLSLMLVVAGFKKAGVFEVLTKRLLELAHNTRALAAILVGICFFSSMFITNDVALITFVPLGVMILENANKQKLLIPVIVLQTVAANLGSMLTPLGNPQNLYIYSLSKMTLWQFLGVMVLPTAISFLMLAASLLFIKPENVKPSESGCCSINPAGVLAWAILFALCLAAVLRFVHYGAALAAVLLWALFTDRKLLLNADYGLLFTFVFLFILIGNVKSVEAISSALSALVGGRELASGILLSQIISNVPAAMLVSKFTSNYSELLIGVNLGGLGTLIASMASVISYKLYSAIEGARTGKYIALFTGVNLLFLGVLWAAALLFNVQ